MNQIQFQQLLEQGFNRIPVYREVLADLDTPLSTYLKLADAPSRKRVLYIIRNARLDPDWANVERRTFSIATRAISSLTRTQGIGDLYRIYATAQRDGLDFNLTYIPKTFDTPHREEFDTAYMRSLFDVGLQAGKDGRDWQKYPPGFEAPVEGTPASAPQR